MELLFLLSIGKNFFTALETNKKTPDQNGRVFFSSSNSQLLNARS